MSVNSAESYLQILHKSKLLSSGQLDKARSACSSAGDARSAARLLIEQGLINKWQALQLLAGRFALTLGKYRLLDQIDANETERVYLAEHSQLGRQVAVKTLSRRHVMDHPELVKRLIDDARKLAALDHRNLIHVYDVDTADDRFFVVFEYVTGETLQELVAREGPLPVADAVRYVAQAAGGMAYAHEQRLVHGAIGPDNLLIDRLQGLKVLNLCMRTSSRPAQSPAAGDNGGRPGESAYSAPELQHGHGQAEPFSDVYSLGATLYFLLTGQAPAWSADADTEAMVAQLRELRPEVTVDLAGLCAQMMARQPAARLASTQPVREELEQWLAQEETEAEAGPPAEAADASAAERGADDEEEAAEALIAVEDIQDEALPAAAERGAAEPEEPGSATDAEPLPWMLEETPAAEPDDTFSFLDQAAGRPTLPLPEKKAKTSAAPKPAPPAKEESRPSAGAAPKARDQRAEPHPAKAAAAPQPGSARTPPPRTAKAASKPAPAPAAERAVAEVIPEPADAAETLDVADATPPQPASEPQADSDIPTFSLPIKLSTGPGAKSRKAKPAKEEKAAAEPAAPKAAAPAAAKPAAEAPKPASTPADSPSKPPLRKGGGPAHGSKSARRSGHQGKSLQLPPKVVLIGSIAGGVLVLLLAALMFFLIFGRKKKTETQEPEGTAKQVASKDTGTAGDGEAKAQPDAAAPGPGDAAKEPGPGESEPKPETAPGTTPATETKKEKTVPGAKTEGPKEPISSPKPAPAEPKAQEKPAAKPQPTPEPKKEPTPKTTPATEKPKTESPKPKTESPKPAKPAKKPFQDFPAVAALPELGGAETALGSIYLGEQELCFIKLRGASRACKGDVVFDVRNANGGRAPRDWEVSIGKGESEDTKVVATLKLDDTSQLRFQWDAGGAKLAHAGALRNCVLALTSGGDTHFAALREPVKVDPFAVDLDKPAALKGDWKIPDMPDTALVKIAIENLEGAKYHVEPSPLFDVEKGKAEVKLDDGGGILALGIATLLKKSGQTHQLQLAVTPFVTFPGSSKPERFNRRLIDGQKQQIEAQIGMMKMGKQQQELMAKVKPDPARQPRVAEQLRNLDAQIKLGEETLKKVEEFEETLKKVAGNLRLSFRMYYNADGTEVNLLTVGSGTPAKK